MLSANAEARTSSRHSHKWRDRTAYVLYVPLGLLEKLAPLVPPPPLNRMRHGGTFPGLSLEISNCAMRSRAIRLWSSPRMVCKNKRKILTAKIFTQQQVSSEELFLAELMKRVWDVNVLKCDCCGAGLRILCAVHAPDAIVRVLDWLNLHSPLGPGTGHELQMRNCPEPTC